MATDPIRTLLVIDDDTFFCDLVSQLLSTVANLEIKSATTGKNGKNICKENRIDIVVLDQKLPDIEGLKLCEPILAYNDRTKIIFITAYPSFDHAVKALKLGAYDYLSKPVENEELILSVNKALRAMELEHVEQFQQYKNRMDNEETVLVGLHEGLKEIQRLIALSANSSAPVLITGETGTGKNVVAKSIHYSSIYKKRIFMSINCAALPENLIEAELFGYEKGAFTGAETSQKGIFEIAEGGTLFLDEIGELPLHLQSKLLGVLDEKRIRRIGGRSMIPVNIRVIASTNLNIEHAIKQKKFRSDLFYRISVMRLHLPPLRDRLQDIPNLCDYFIKMFTGQTLINISEYEILQLQKYQWPGNVRELRNIMERALMLRKGNTIHPSQLLYESAVCLASPLHLTSAEGVLPLEEVERTHIQMTLQQMDFNHQKTAQALGISRSTLHRKLNKYHRALAVSK